MVEMYAKGRLMRVVLGTMQNSKEVVGVTPAKH